MTQEEHGIADRGFAIHSYAGADGIPWGTTPEPSGHRPDGYTKSARFDSVPISGT